MQRESTALHRAQRLVAAGLMAPPSVTALGPSPPGVPTRLANRVRESRKTLSGSALSTGPVARGAQNSSSAACDRPGVVWWPRSSIPTNTEGKHVPRPSWPSLSRSSQRSTMPGDRPLDVQPQARLELGRCCGPCSPGLQRCARREGHRLGCTRYRRPGHARKTKPVAERSRCGIGTALS